LDSSSAFFGAWEELKYSFEAAYFFFFSTISLKSFSLVNVKTVDCAFFFFFFGFCWGVILGFYFLGGAATFVVEVLVKFKETFELSAFFDSDLMFDFYGVCFEIYFCKVVGMTLF